MKSSAKEGSRSGFFTQYQAATKKSFLMKIVQVHFVNQPKSTANRLRAIIHVLYNSNTTISTNPENVCPVMTDHKKFQTLILMHISLSTKYKAKQQKLREGEHRWTILSKKYASTTKSNI